MANAGLAGLIRKPSPQAPPSPSTSRLTTSAPRSSRAVETSSSTPSVVSARAYSVSAQAKPSSSQVLTCTPARRSAPL